MPQYFEICKVVKIDVSAPILEICLHFVLHISSHAEAWGDNAAIPYWVE